MPTLLPMLALLGCGPPAPRVVPAAPAIVAIVGIDGGDWDVLQPLIDAGKLPALRWMQEKGAWSRLDIDSPQSPESWTSIASGQHPAVHGIVQKDASPMGTFAAGPDEVRVKRLWDMAGERGTRVLVVDWWVTSPPYPVNGVMVSRESRDSHPADAATQTLAPIQPRSHVEAMARLALLAPQTGTMKHWMAKGGFGLMMLPIYTVDHALHALWSEYRVSLDPEAMAALTSATRQRVGEGRALFEEAAVMADTLLGHAYHSVGADGYVIVVSDHGFTRANPSERRLAIARRFFDGGRGTVERGTFQKGEVTFKLESQEKPVRDEVPELDHVIRHPVVTLEGSRAGIEEARERILSARLPDGSPLMMALGDRLLPTDDALALVESSLGGIQADDCSVFVNSGAHRREDQGIFGIWGPDVVPGPMQVPVATVDIAPTALWLMGHPTGADMAGHALVDALSEAGRGKRPLRSVPTYEDGTRPWAIPSRDALSTDELERLKALGYVK